MPFTRHARIWIESHNRVAPLRALRMLVALLCVFGTLVATGVAACSSPSLSSTLSPSKISPPSARPGRPAPPTRVTGSIGQSSQALGEVYLPALFIGFDGGCTVTQGNGGTYSHSGTTTRTGVDCAAACKTPVRAPAGGAETRHPSWGGWGNASRVHDDVDGLCVGVHHLDSFGPSLAQVFTSDVVGYEGATGASSGCHVHYGSFDAACGSGAAAVPWRYCARVGSVDQAVTCDDAASLTVGKELFFGGFNERAVVGTTESAFIAQLVARGQAPAAADGDAIVFAITDDSQDTADTWEIMVQPLRDGAYLVAAIDRFENAPAAGLRPVYIGAWWATVAANGDGSDWERVSDGPSIEVGFDLFAPSFGFVAPNGSSQLESEGDWLFAIRTGELDGETTFFVVAQNVLDHTDIAATFVRGNEVANWVYRAADLH